ncbi:MAG: hypothetical protein JSW34_03125 [Candidatus Zixiibacteriota bacterium]|nr:MAG: hypothetical protein JSW34_03125 [candidate division Zixibacteria bacterium]
MNRVKSNLGGALIIALGIMLMLTIAALMAVNRAETDINLSFNQLHYDQSFYVAEAGLRRAFQDLNDDNAWAAGYADVVFEEGTYWVAVDHWYPTEPLRDTVDVRATGRVQAACANVRALIVPELLFPFDYAVYGDDSILLDQNTNTASYHSDPDSGTFATTLLDSLGDVASNGTVTLDNSASIGGDASSSADPGVIMDPTCTVTEDTASGLPPYPLEPIDEEAMADAMANNDNLTGISGTYDLGADTSLAVGNGDSVHLATGIYYFTDVTLDENSTLTVDDGVTIYMSGDMLLSNNTSVNPYNDPADLLIISTGSIQTVGNDVDLHVLFYGPDADVYLANSCVVYGSIVANSVVIKNTASIYYDRALAEIPLRTTGRMLMIAWSEE